MILLTCLAWNVFQSLVRSICVCNTYLEFLDYHLPGILDGILAPQRVEIIFQYDEDPAHSSNFLTQSLRILKGLVPRDQFFDHLDRQICFHLTSFFGVSCSNQLRKRTCQFAILEHLVRKAILQLKDDLSLRASMVPVGKRARKAANFNSGCQIHTSYQMHTSINYKCGI